MSQQRKKRVTLRDVAIRANVSQKTVSNVINDWPFVSAQTRARVQDALNETGYRPSQVARSLVTGRTRTVGIVVPDISNPFFSTAFRGCEDQLTEQQYSVFLCNTDENLEKERYYLESLVSRGVDGLILWGSQGDQATLCAAVGDDLPIVSIDGAAQEIRSRHTNIRLDNAGAAEQIVCHLLTHGRRRIAHIMGASHRFTAQERLKGYRRALEAAHLYLDPALLVEDSPSIAGGYSATLKLRQRLQEVALPDGIFCYNDLMAIGAMAALEEMDLKVPADVAVVGFDDITPAALVTPMLTTVAVPQYDLGRLAAGLLMEHLNGTESPAQMVNYSLTLKVRTSCGAYQMSSAERRTLLRQLATSAGAGLPPQPLRLPG